MNTRSDFVRVWIGEVIESVTSLTEDWGLQRELERLIPYVGGAPIDSEQMVYYRHVRRALIAVHALRVFEVSNEKEDIMAVDAAMKNCLGGEQYRLFSLGEAPP